MVLIAQLVLTVSQHSRWIYQKLDNAAHQRAGEYFPDFRFPYQTDETAYPVFRYQAHRHDLRQRIEDNQRIQSFLTGNLINMSFEFFIFIIYSFALAFYDWVILLVFYAGTGLYVLWILLFMEKRKEIDYKLFNVSSANQSRLSAFDRHARDKAEQLRKTKGGGSGNEFRLSFLR